MAAEPIKPIAVDLNLNDPATLCIYNELLLFRVDASASELTYQCPDQFKQKTLHAVADFLGLDYEYWKSVPRVRISRREQEQECAQSISNAKEKRNTTSPPNFTGPYPTNNLEPELYDLLDLPNLPTSSFGYELEASSFLSSLENSHPIAFTPEDMPIFDTDLMCPFPISEQANWFSDDALLNFRNSPTFWNDISPFSPHPTHASNSAAASEEFATIFTDTSFFPSPRRGSRSGSKAGSGAGSRAVSRAGSAKSIPVERGRKFSKSASRSSSANGSSGPREIVFDSNPSRAQSGISKSSGRKGPLDAMARAAMKAVKVLGACWRCKIMRKECDEDSPCSSCPKGRVMSMWRCVGCRRGNLKSQMQDIPLCNPPASENLEDVSVYRIPDLAKDCQSIHMLKKANACFQQSVIRKAEHTMTENGSVAGEWAVYEAVQIDDGKKGSCTRDPFLHYIRRRWEALGLICVDQISSVGHPSPAVLVPLDGCILDILGDFFDSHVIKEIVHAEDDTSAGVIFIMLRCAALYQARLLADSDHLVGQSLICLRHCFEALRVNATIPITNEMHTACKSESCKVDCILSLTTSISIFVDELSKVFFKKENMRNQRWWLSVFYSFCIQSIVRRALIHLSCSQGLPITAFTGAKQYLYLPLRLFNATSGLSDPMSRAAPRELEEDFERAKFATDHQNWKALGMNSSAEYLNQLFDTDGVSFLSRDSGKDNIWTLRRQVGEIGEIDRGIPRSVFG